MARRGSHLGVPDLLSGDDRGAAGPSLARPARSRADAVVCVVVARRPLQSAAARCGAVPLRGIQGRGDGERRGAIIGELPSGIRDGLGGAILNFNQFYVSGPPKLWAAIIVAAVVGIGFFALVRAAEVAFLRGRIAPSDT